MQLPGALLPEVPCPRCDRHVAGLAWGELCPACRAERLGRARRLATRAALAATALMLAYVWFRFPAVPFARLYGAITVLATYIIVRQIVTRLALEFLPK